MGGDLIAAIEAMASLDRRSLTDEELIERMRLAQRAATMLEASRIADLEVVDRRGVVAAEHGSTQAWLRTEQLIDGRTAARDLHLARDLADALPETARRFAAGDLTARHAQQIARLRKVATPESLLAVEARLAELATHLGVKHLADAVTETIHSLSPEQLAQDERDLYDQRELHLSSTIGGAGVGHWLLDPIAQERLATAIHAAGAPAKGDERSAAARRADALMTIIDFFLKHGQDAGVLPTGHGTATSVTALVPWELLAGEDGARPAVSGLGGQLSIDAVRRLSCDANLTRVVFGPASEILDTGRATRLFSTAAWRAVVARDRHCIWPGCEAPASWCELHHGIHWLHGGRSDTDNAFLICGRHHDRVHQHRHQLVIRADGSRTVDLRRDRAVSRGCVDDRRQEPLVSAPRAAPRRGTVLRT